MFTLQSLPYDYNDLEPYITKTTLEIHHDKHHAGYVNKLNELLAPYEEFADLELEQLLKQIDRLPDPIRQAVFNNAGQVYNHNVYWESLAPKSKSVISDRFEKIISHSFSSLEEFKKVFSNAGVAQFGSGWVWLSVNLEGLLEVEKTSNADTPLIRERKPIMVMDVWEHAYYLDYQNRRPEYISSFFEIVNWPLIEGKYNAAVS